MLTYLARRISQLIVILLGSSFLVFNLEAIAGDPLEELRTSSDPRKAQMIIDLTRKLDLNTPPPLRYFKWLGGVFTGHWGVTRDGQNVITQISQAIPTTVRLVLAATIIAILVGIAIGVVTALRQYSRFDYAVTFISFLFFSLPIFWVAVLLKQFMSIGFNDWLADPQVTLPWLIFFGLLAGVFWAGVIGGNLKRVLTIGAIAGTSTVAILWALGATKWFASPTLGIVFVVGMGAGLALLVTLASTGLGNKPSRNTALAMVVLGGILYYPLQPLFTFLKTNYNGWFIVALAAGAVLVGAATGYFFAKEDRKPVMRTGAIVAFLVGGLIMFDRIMQEWSPYVTSDFVSNRPIPTLGQSNDGLVAALDANPNMWMGTLDSLLHIILPTIALTLISFAGYVRYTRGNLLEVLNQDYIRTARAKGLSERTVIMRHAFRNSLIPLTTLMAWDFAGILGGAIITESVFSWVGMGTLFRRAIVSFDLNLLMGVFLITSSLAVLANLVSDLLYSALDPRIRVGSGN